MPTDTFKTLANHYDAMMSHVNYERWVVVSTMIAKLCPDENFHHLDVGCGTGALLGSLRQSGWNSYGADLSFAMTSKARMTNPNVPVIQADMTQLPFYNQFPFMTCVFDSLNFLLEREDFDQAFRSMRQSMTDDGILYFDIITERMVLDHYAEKDWIDKNGPSDMRWHGKYDVDNRIIENTIWIDEAHPSTVRERIYTIDEACEAANKAGLNILTVLDTETWTAPTKDTLRLDIIASVQHDQELENRFQYIQQDIQILLDEFN